MKTSGAIILVFDLGTTNLKAALVDASGHLIAVARRPAPVTAADGRAEMSIAAFEAALVALANDLASTADLEHVQAVSFSSQGNSFALIDTDGAAITPIVLWSDERAINIDQPLNSLPELHAVTGVPTANHYLAQAKLRWLAKNDPDVAQRARKISLISDVFCEWLTGLHVTEPGLACLTALASRVDPRWLPHHIELLGLPPLQWPRLLIAGSEVGPILPATADRLGISRSARLFMGCLDQYAGAIGTGAASPGSVCETTGTVLAAVQCVAATAPLPGPGIFVGSSFSPDLSFRMTFSSTSANLLEWYRSKHVPAGSFNEIIRLARSSPTAALVRRVDTSPEASFDAADLERGPGHVVKGIMRRVCEELAALISELRASGVPIRAAGGAAQSDTWLQMKADRLGVPILAASAQEPACLGAAMLAATGLGIGSVDSLAERWCKPRATFLPTKGGTTDVRS